MVYYRENILAFIDYYLQPTSSQKGCTHIKDTNHFLKNVKELGTLPKNTILCTIDVVGVYLNIPHKEGLASFIKHFTDRGNKEVAADTLVKLEDIKNNYIQFLDKTFK